MKKILKWFAYLSLGIVTCIGLQKFCRSKTDGFALCKIRSSMVFHPEFETNPLNDDQQQELNTALDQRYHYLGKGAQCFAFVSDDGQFVIKFFKLYQLCPSPWLISAPMPAFLEGWRKEKVERKWGELGRDFISYKIGFDYLKKDTGLIYLHLNKSNQLKKNLTLYDKIKVEHHIDLDSMQFLIQKKADLFYPALKKLIDRGQIQQAKANIEQLVEYLAIRSRLGFYDKDPDINTNFGIAGDKTVQIDVGRFRPDPSRTDPLLYIDDIRRITDNLRQWLQELEPSLALVLLDSIQQLNKQDLNSTSNLHSHE